MKRSKVTDYAALTVHSLDVSKFLCVFTLLVHVNDGSFALSLCFYYYNYNYILSTNRKSNFPLCPN